MTMRTFTINTKLAKVAPVDPSFEMEVEGQEALENSDASGAVYRAMLAAVPDTLPGVIEHPAPAAIVSAEAYDRLQALADSQAARILAFEDANPAPAQPVERQELSDPQIRGIAVCDGGGYQDDETAVWTFSDAALMQFTRAIIAADRGPA